MDIKSNKLNIGGKTLPSYHRWISVLTAGIKATPAGKPPVIVLDEFASKLLERDLSECLGDESGASETVRAFRHCFETYAGDILERTVNHLTELGFEEIDATITASRGGSHDSGYMSVLYRPRADWVDFQLFDGYVHYGIDDNSFTDYGNGSLADKTKERKFKIVAKDQENQKKIDELSAVVEAVAKAFGMYVYISGTGSENYPTIQALLDISTPNGPVMRKFSLTFENSFAELVSLVPIETPVLTFTKKDLKE